MQLSTKLAQDGRLDEEPEERRRLQRHHQHDLEAEEAVLNADAAETEAQLVKALEEEHTSQLRDQHRGLLERVRLW